MAERRITIKIDIDLDKYSKEAHAVTVRRIAYDVGQYATQMFTDNGYTVRASNLETTIHYVRHVIAVKLFPKKLRIVKKASSQ